MSSILMSILGVVLKHVFAELHAWIEKTRQEQIAKRQIEHALEPIDELDRLTKGTG